MLLSLYVPLTRVPVNGIASCKSVFVDVLSLGVSVLNELAIVVSFYYHLLRNRSGISNEKPVLPPVTLIMLSIELNWSPIEIVVPNFVNNAVEVLKFVEA